MVGEGHPHRLIVIYRGNWSLPIAENHLAGSYKQGNARYAVLRDNGRCQQTNGELHICMTVS